MTHRNAVLAAVLGLSLLFSDSAVLAQGNRPQLYTSKTFLMMTDLPAEQAKEQLTQLEVMLKLVEAYYGRRCRKPIRIYAVDQLSNWSPEHLQAITAKGMESIRDRAGVTETTTTSIVGGPRIDADATVYCVSDAGVVRHESIHAYCGLTFGHTGPVWYSEGMAEVGQYFQEGDKGVTARQRIIDYLQSQPPKPLMEIIDNPLESTGDSWQNYAWRWAVCHMLGMNRNYGPRFKPLGLALMTGVNTSFRDVYGTQIPEIDFEYRLFLQDMKQGYRNDLCSWDWKAKFNSVAGRFEGESRIFAARGWQPSKVILKAGTTYQITTKGEWSLAKNEPPVTAAGGEDGRGVLMGIIFDDYQLSEPFEIGAARTFTVPRDGKLHLRCGDDWGSIGDNSGAIQVRIGLAR
ncbi:MAG TPA: hypothetical protein VNQ76_09745 [Planctomicrobium sp.]|nr:hypothetical protein [Planctomicrobium sp.]